MKRSWLLNEYLRSAEFLNAPASARGAWVALQGYCSERGNGGIIVGAAAYTPSTWRRLTGTGGGRVAIDKMVAADLARWTGSDLELAGYDHESELAYRRRLDGARKGGFASGESRRDRREVADEPPANLREASDELERPQPQAIRPPSSTSPSNYPAALTEEQSPEPEGIERVGEGLWQDGPASLSPGPPTLIAAFEKEYKRTHCVPYRTNSVERGKAPGLWARLSPVDRSALVPRIRVYLSVEMDASLVGFVEWTAKQGT